MSTQTIAEYLDEERQKYVANQLRVDEEAARIRPLQHGHHGGHAAAAGCAQLLRPLVADWRHTSAALRQGILRSFECSWLPVSQNHLIQTVPFWPLRKNLGGKRRPSTHPSKIAKGGAASVVEVQRWATPAQSVNCCCSGYSSLRSNLCAGFPARFLFCSVRSNRSSSAISFGFCLSPFWISSNLCI